MKLPVRSIVMVVLVAAGTASATLVDLYSEDDAVLAGSAANGHTRNQRISPTQSTPNSIGGPGQESFDSVAMHIGYTDPTESGTVRLRLFAWSVDISTTLAGAPIADTGDFAVPAPSDLWLTLSLPAPQPATGQYLVSLLIVSTSQNPAGLRIYRSNSNDGGTNNDAYHDTTLRTDREFSVRLNAMPEPASLSLLVLGLPLVLRRRR